MASTGRNFSSSGIIIFAFIVFPFDCSSYLFWMIIEDIHWIHLYPRCLALRTHRTQLPRVTRRIRRELYPKPPPSHLVITYFGLPSLSNELPPGTRARQRKI